MEMQTQTTNSKMTAIERALAAAKARKAAKSAEDTGDLTQEASEEKPEKTKAPKADREAAKAQREEERAKRAEEKAAKLAAEAEAKAAKKLEREAAKAAKAAEKAAAKGDKKPAHMKKVERARAKLPTIQAEAARLFDEITSNLPIGQIDALAQHLLVQARAMRTARACSSTPLPLGAVVTITGGEAKYIGMTGTVVHSQKLRAKVAVEGVKNPVYIYTGEAEVSTPEAPAAAAE